MKIMNPRIKSKCVGIPIYLAIFQEKIIKILRFSGQKCIGKTYLHKTWVQLFPKVLFCFNFNKSKTNDFFEFIIKMKKSRDQHLFFGILFIFFSWKLPEIWPLISRVKVTGWIISTLKTLYYLNSLVPTDIILSNMNCVTVFLTF